MTETMQNALLRLGQSIADAALAGLQDGDVGSASMSELITLVDSQSIAEHIVAGVVVADAGSLDGAAGRSLVVISPEDARGLAPSPRATPEDAAPGTDADADPEDADADADDGTDTDDATDTDADTDTDAGTTLPVAVLDAVAAIADRMNGSAASALTILLGQPVGYDAARATIVEDPRFVLRPGPVQAICAVLQVSGVTLRLIQFAPNALVMRAARAFEDLAQNVTHGLPGTGGTGPSIQTLNGIRLRVWAELGRAELGLADALALPLGTVVELDRDADAPVDLVVNGMRFGTGRLIVTDDGEWALTLDEVGAGAQPL